MQRNSRLLIAAAAVAAGALLMPAPGHAQGVQAGTLTCNIGGGWGFIIGSSRPIACTFMGPAGPEHYAGNISKLGMDIGFLAGSQMVWNVVAAAPPPARGELSGTYTGVTGSAAVGVGAGANVLVGGNGRAFTLQPVSFEGQSGLDVAAGLATVNLQYQG